MTFEVGQSAQVTKRFDQQAVGQFAELSEDFNPVHLDEEYAKNTQFGGTIVHGMLVSSLISGLLGYKMPGQGTIYLGQNLSFKRPVYVGDQVTAIVTIAHIRDDKPIATVKTQVVDQHGKVCVDGEAVVLLPK
ncbi:MaoC family dehydratase [Thalassotalea ponticola]|uniref:MaoC family dehydratase n=1 Tax=Thalassotalea ponticola TaxID=1523392 RepID=UPI0025B5A1E4|nr:MaoC family dehydratase [Thalassotalea ponticola]MDN3652366.1 MaoC family dehydratase [Thalassotalea ponticola]